MKVINARIWQIERFNKVLEEGGTGEAVGLFFSYHHKELPEANVTIYKN